MKQNIDYTIPDELVAGTDVQTSHVTPTSGLSYKRGDLLTVNANNVASHSVTLQDWHVVCAVDVSAEQVEKHLTAKKGIPVYTSGRLNVYAVRKAGEPLTADERTKVMARTVRAMSSIVLTEPFGN